MLLGIDTRAVTTLLLKFFSQFAEKKVSLDWCRRHGKLKTHDVLPPQNTSFHILALRFPPCRLESQEHLSVS